MACGPQRQRSAGAGQPPKGSKGAPGGPLLSVCAYDSRGRYSQILYIGESQELTSAVIPRRAEACVERFGYFILSKIILSSFPKPGSNSVSFLICSSASFFSPCARYSIPSS